MFIPSHVSFIVNSNSENCIKIRWFFTKLHPKISWLRFFIAHGVDVYLPGLIDVRGLKHLGDVFEVWDEDVFWDVVVFHFGDDLS